MKKFIVLTVDIYGTFAERYDVKAKSAKSAMRDAMERYLSSPGSGYTQEAAIKLAKTCAHTSYLKTVSSTGSIWTGFIEDQLFLVTPLSKS